MKIYVLIATAFCLSLVSCKQDNPLIDNSSKTWNMLTVNGENSNHLSSFEQPTGTMIKDNLLADSLAKSPITQVIAYGSNIYLLIPKDYKIIVLNRWNYDYEASFDFSTDKYEPTAIAFANATDAYVAHQNTDKLSLIDLKFYKIARTITVGNAPVAIAYSKNTIVVANSKSNSISLIDTRTYSKIADIETKEVPTFISSTLATTGLVSLVCSGNGKEDSLSSSKSSAYLQIFNPDTKQFTSTTELKTTLIAGADIIPTGLVVTDKDYSFVSTKSGLFLYNAKSATPLTFVKKETYKGITYNFPKEELIIIRANNTAFAAKQTTGKILYELSMPLLFGTVVAY